MNHHTVTKEQLTSAYPDVVTGKDWANTILASSPVDAEDKALLIMFISFVGRTNPVMFHVFEHNQQVFQTSDLDEAIEFYNKIGE
jgi:hypothetical protein